MKALGRGTAGWMPYSEDPAKRARYRSFLEVRAGLRPEGTLPDRIPGSSNDDWVKEMNEFANAAQIFKPMTGIMATRFTTSSSGPQAASETVKPDGTNNSSGEPQLLTKPAGKKKTPAEEAAAVGMYGPLTRSVENFYPTRLLCKRFNVQPPSLVQVDPGGAPPGSDTGQNAGAGGTPQRHSNALPQKRLELVGKKDMDELRMSGGGMRTFEQASGVRADGEDINDGPILQAKPEITLIDPERNEALEKERPGDAVFKAIFGSDSEDD
jgi:G patch domain-containing protein 1